MITIGGIIVLIDDIRRMTLLELGKDFKDALLHYYRYDTTTSSILETLIDDNTRINVLAKCDDDLHYIFSFFSSVRLSPNQIIYLRTFNISNKEFLDSINLYESDLILNKFILKVDNEDWVCLRKYKLFLEKFNNVISNIPQNSSQLEIIKYAYDYTKSKEYKNVPYDERSLLSRNLTSSFLGNYIVCAGYTRIFNEILREFNIPCTEYKFQIKEMKAHSVSLVNIKDDKYGINGIYLFDASQDSYIPGNDFNETKYKGFMLPINSYMQDNLLIDSFHLILKNDFNTLNNLFIEFNDESLKAINIFDKKYTDILQTLFDSMEIDYELFANDCSEFGNNGGLMEVSTLYKFCLILKNEFGKEITRETFIQLLKNTNQDYTYLVNSFISKFDEVRDTDLIELQKIKTT